MDEIVISAMSFILEKDLTNIDFVHRDLRVMDYFTQMAVIAVDQLLKNAKSENDVHERTGMILTTNTGPFSSVRELNMQVKEKGHIGINPSKFPNIMLSTSLSRAASTFQIKGPTVAKYHRGSIAQAILYASIQITKGSSDRVIVLKVDEGYAGFGLLVEKEKTAMERGVTARFRLIDRYKGYTRNGR